MKMIIFSLMIALLPGFQLTSHAQEIVTVNDIAVGSRALGMGGAQIAAANDVTAVINNPAALARINQLEFQLGLNMLKREINTKLNSNLAYGSGNVTDTFTGLGTIGIAYPVPTDQGSLVFALAYNRVKNFSGRFKLDGYNEHAFITDDEVWGGNEKNEVIEKGGFGVVSLGGAVDVSPTVSFGLAIDIWTGSYSVDNRFLRNDYTGEVSWLDITGGEDDISAWSIKPAVLYSKDNFRLGAYMRLPMTFHIDQDNYEEYYSRNDGSFFTIHENIDAGSGAGYLDSNDYWSSSYKIKAPMQIGFGLSIGHPGKRLVAFDMVYENWKEAEFDDEYDPYYFSDKYRSSLNLRLGLEQRLPFIGAVGRIGYLHQPVTFKGPRSDESGEPIIDVVNERDFITLGLGKDLDKSLRLDIGYAYGFWSVEEGYREDEENHNSLYITMSYQMTTPQ